MKSFINSDNATIVDTLKTQTKSLDSDNKINASMIHSRNQIRWDPILYLSVLCIPLEEWLGILLPFFFFPPHSFVMTREGVRKGRGRRGRMQMITIRVESISHLSLNNNKQTKFLQSSETGRLRKLLPNRSLGPHVSRVTAATEEEEGTTHLINWTGNIEYFCGHLYLQVPILFTLSHTQVHWLSQPNPDSGWIRRETNVSTWFIHQLYLQVVYDFFDGINV